MLITNPRRVAIGANSNNISSGSPGLIIPTMRIIITPLSFMCHGSVGRGRRPKF